MQETASVLGSGRPPGGGHGNPFQYSCLKNPLDRGAWWATVQGVRRVRHNLATKQQQLANISPNLDALDFYIFEFCPLTSCTIMFLNRAWVKNLTEVWAVFIPQVVLFFQISQNSVRFQSLLSKSWASHAASRISKWSMRSNDYHAFRSPGSLQIHTSDHFNIQTFFEFLSSSSVIY